MSSCIGKPNLEQTVEFRLFLRDFFKKQEFQKQHIQFPLEINYYSYDESVSDIAVLTKRIKEDEWEHYESPDHYRCEVDCFDLMIYDSFKKEHKETGERVLSFEGVENGINSSLYFKKIKGQWYLVRHEQFDI